MEGRLRRLFDYQRFEKNPELQQMIDSTHLRNRSRELSLDDLEMVSAAGIPESAWGKNPDKKLIK